MYLLIKLMCLNGFDFNFYSFDFKLYFKVIKKQDNNQPQSNKPMVFDINADILKNREKINK